MTSIEAFHLHSSSDEWPNSVAGRSHFHGTIDIALAKQAWEHCLGRQTFAAWPIINTKGRPKWSTNIDSDRLPQVAEDTFHEIVLESWPESESEFDLPNVNDRGLPLVSAIDNIGFGLWCIHSSNDQRVTIILTTDHALADGVSGMGFVRQWMTAYHNLCNKEDINRGLIKLDWTAWKKRSHLGLFSWSFLKYLPCQAIGLFGATKFVLRKFSTIEPKNSASLPPINSPGIAGRTIEPDLIDQLNDRAERLAVSVNSLMMTIVFRAMKRIRDAIESEQGCQWKDRKWIRLVLPIGIRGIADRKLPCTNKASLVQVERTFDQVSNADAAAQSIDREVRIIMGFKLDLVFLIAIRLLSTVPSFLRFAAGNQKSRGTVVFTNLGEPFRKTRACNFREVGGLKMQEYDLCGPIRSGTPINIAWSTFKRPIGDKLCVHGRISLHFDRVIISTELASAIADALEKELREVVQFGGSGG